MKNSLILLQIPLLLSILFLNTGCGSNSSMPNPKIKEGTKPPRSALNSASQVFDSRFARDGSSYYTIKVIAVPDSSSAMRDYMKSVSEGNIDVSLLEQDVHPMMLYRMELIELKGIYTEVVGNDLSEADKLNGISWKGSVTVKTKSERRRDLDLTMAFNRLVDGQEQTPIIWADKQLIWRPSEEASAGLKSYIEESNRSADELSEEEKLARIWSGLLGGDLMKAFLEGYQETEWGDWWTPDGNAYQVSEIEVRDSVPQIVTLESIENVLADQKSLSLFFPTQGGSMGMFGGLLSSAAIGDEESFLVKPNLDALKSNGVIE